MTSRLNDWSLRSKFRLMAGVLSAVFVIAAITINSTVDIADTLSRARERISSQAEAAASAAGMALDDDPVALGALDMLRQYPGILAVTLNDQAGRARGASLDKLASPTARSQVPFAAWSELALHIPVQSDTGARGMLHIQATVGPDVVGALKRCTVFALAILVIGAGFAGLLMLLLHRMVSSPVERLIRRTRELRSSADLPERPDRPGRSEFGQLGQELIDLLIDTRRSDRNLQAFKTEFERRVQERTQQLDAAVKDAQDAATRAESASRAKSDFLARMSHEIRTPMNGVLGMADLLQHSPTLDERQRRYAIVIHQSGNALLRLINDVLDFSKIEAKKLELDQSRFCIREMVEDSLEMLAERAQSKGLELLCHIPVTFDTVVFGDSLRLRQVIINLLGNAVKFTERGDIVVTVDRRETDLERATFDFEVSDTGIGIEEKDYEAIFEAFAQADGSTTRRYGGTGLGLAICKQLIELMGGTITVSSVVGEGSTFRFSVPLAVDRTAVVEKPRQVLTETRILVVDKSAAVRQMLGQHLKSWGGFFTEFGSAHEALTRLNTAFQGEVDLLVIDAHLHGTTAVEMVGAVRRIPAFVETPILMLHTGSGEPPAESRGMRGPVAWQSKPIRRSLLQKSLVRLLKGGSSSNESESESSKVIQTQGSARRLATRRVLLVEDNPVNQEVAGAMLQSLGIAVDTASNGAEGLARLRAERYDAVLMDCQMPELDGYETTRRLRKWEVEATRPHTPVVALTANALSGDAEKCFAAGMDHYLTKPFTIEQLQSVLEYCAAPDAKVVTGSGPTESALNVQSAVPAKNPAVSSEAPVVMDAESTEAVLNSQAVARIRNLAGSGGRDLLPRLAALYASSSTALLDTLREAAGGTDAQAVIEAAHALKSSSGNVGALRLASMCHDLEAIVRAGNLADAVGVLQRIEGEHRRVLAALASWSVAA